MAIFYYNSRVNEGCNHYEDIGKSLAENMKNGTKITFISGTPNDSSATRQRRSSANQNLKKLGVNITESKIFPNKESRWDFKNIRNYILGSDMIFLLGGCPHKQIAYIQETQMDGIIEEFIGERNKIIFGVSGGTATMSEFAITPRSSETYQETKISSGLNLELGISVFPHVDLENGAMPDVIMTSEDGYFNREEFMKISEEYTYLLLPNHGSLIINNGNIEIIGSMPYIIEKRRITSLEDYAANEDSKSKAFVLRKRG